MPTRVAINGFGRIGRLVLRAIVEQGRKDLEVVAINDLGSVATNAHLLQYDTAHGRFPGNVKAGKKGIDFGRGEVPVLAERDPAKLPWKDLKVDVALECTGIFVDRVGASKHLEAGARRVLISAPATGEDITVVRGVNHAKLKKSHRIIS
ncbi:MAG: glyceraldehyde-3-phosphate dehydrogenase, partial [Pseudomonadota bacterium]